MWIGKFMYVLILGINFYDSQSLEIYLEVVWIMDEFTCLIFLFAKVWLRDQYVLSSRRELIQQEIRD